MTIRKRRRFQATPKNLPDSTGRSCRRRQFSVYYSYVCSFMKQEQVKVRATLQEELARLRAKLDALNKQSEDA